MCYAKIVNLLLALFAISRHAGLSFCQGCGPFVMSPLFQNYSLNGKSAGSLTAHELLNLIWELFHLEELLTKPTEFHPTIIPSFSDYIVLSSVLMLI